MTERQRLQRAHMLLVLVKKGNTEAEAWRKANPGSRSKVDKSAAKMWQREVDRLEQWLQEHPGGVPVPPGKWWEPANLCDGAGDRPCGKEIPRRQKRCRTCADEQRRLNKRGYRRNYYQAHREQCNAKRNAMRDRQQARELAEAAGAAEQEEKERRDSQEQVIVGEDGRPCLYDPKTGTRKYWKPPPHYIGFR